ncbi:polysaccharide deacetylase family protein [Romeria aff. gracilis LEGE 07310]|uniref:Polysaccharide deacetylase family protein n=1 Tax=Vasconcelosia minhoensis LEGE 07310 TaxID=915328 RepID=A0A8J7DM80_9CYAN|nr:chitin deacetylase family protein [Romeria gracilis]MBE9076085.1 polysaccharide deacetylase family protein [Romeria aff. gracilis LEGE 07310]
MKHWKLKLGLLSGLGMTVLVGLLIQPRWLLNLIGRVGPGATYYIDTDAQAVALTIDDAPSEATDEILDVLDRYDAKATFFIISRRVPGREQNLTRMVAAGHELGNHLTEDEASILLSATDFEAAVLEADRVLADYGPVRWLRPGMGWYSPGMVATVSRQRRQLVLGSVFPYDTHIASPQFASQFILSSVRPGDIIVLHDGPGRGDRTAKTLKQILPALQAQGYDVVTLSTLAEQQSAKD